MTIDEMIAVMTHHKNGGKVESKSKYGTWILVDDPMWDFGTFNYRIAPADTEPSWQDQLKHICRSGWVVNKVNSRLYQIAGIDFENKYDCISLSWGWIGYDDFIKRYEYTPRPDWMER